MFNISVQKVILAVAFIAAAANNRTLASCGNVEDKNPLMFGEVVEGADLLDRYYYCSAYQITMPIIEFHYSYPHAVSQKLNYTITNFEVFLKAKGLCSQQVFVEEGGVGKKNVSLHIVAENASELYGLVKVYGISPN